jgi:CRP-like cAMP-binding protein
MPAYNQSQIKNGLLKALSEERFREFTEHLESVDLPIKHVLVEVDEPTEHVCFIESGLASVVTTSQDDETIEIGHIGREGIAGCHLALMSERTPNRTFMQLAGSGHQMPASIFMKFLNDDIEVRRLFLNYVQTYELQLAQSVLANGRYSVYERLARWLLMVHDRAEGDDFSLTHEFLSIMLGVRRSGVTDQIHLLEGAHSIKATRGNIRILDRAKLEEIAGGCYGLPEREYRRLIQGRSS